MACELVAYDKDKFYNLHLNYIQKCVNLNISLRSTKDKYTTMSEAIHALVDAYTWYLSGRYDWFNDRKPIDADIKVDFLIVSPTQSKQSMLKLSEIIKNGLKK